MSFLSNPISTLILRPKRSIGDIPLTVVTTTEISDQWEITKFPIEKGASISDHAYKDPTTIRISAYFQENFLTNAANNLNFSIKNNSLKEVYNRILDLNKTLEPFEVIVPKRTISTALLKSVTMVEDKTTNNCLFLNLVLQQVVVVSVTTTTLDKSVQANPKDTSPTTFDGNKSALRVTKDAIQNLFGK